MPGRRYDLVVIGGGAAGLVAARMAASMGARVVLVERARIGGECLYSGCIPSKALLAAAERAHAVRTAAQLGIRASEPEVDFAAVMGHVRSSIEAAGTEDTARALSDAGVEVVEGSASFAEPGVIEAGRRVLRYRAALIATGSRPAVPAIEGLAGTDPLTTEAVFSLTELPGRLTVIGAGPTGCELSQAFARLGSRVTLFEADERILGSEEPEASELLASVLADDGVDVRAGTRFEPSHADGGRVLVAAGRQVDTTGLGLDRVGVNTGPDGQVEVDDRLRTSGSHIYAAGDVTALLELTHFAAYQALVAVVNALFLVPVKTEMRWVPRAVYTAPEVARAGWTEAEARARLGEGVEVYRHDYARNDRAITTGETQGFAKLVCDRRGRLVGATIAAPAAGESIAEPARLIREKKKVGDLSQMVHAYPTFTEGPARAADEVWPRRYLTPRTRALLRPLLAVLRAAHRP